jgi:two-component system, OmpR family, sensor histidine kinase BaeS
MAEKAGPRRRARAGVTAWLALAFVAVSFAAVGLFAVLTVVVESRDVAGLGRQQTTDLARAVAAAAGSAYRAHHGWAGTDLSDALAVAGAAGARVVISDQAGAIVGGRGQTAGSVARTDVPVTVDGHNVGRVSLAPGPSAVERADTRLRHSLAVGLAGSAGAAALLAVGAAAIVSDRISRPLRRLIAATREMSAGRRDVRVGPLPGPRELAELATAYDTMSAAVAEEDRLRRAAAAHVAHELRTPVAILLASVESLLDGITEPTADNLASLRDEALRLTARVEDLQTLASAEAAGLSLREGGVDLAEVAAAAALALDESFAAAGVELRRDISKSWVAGDPGRLHQVVTNLLTNAVKFSPEGSEVHLRVGASDGRAVLEVSDAGPGIEADEVPHLFEPFWRGRAAGSVTGSGIGLAVVADLVAAHHGRLGVDTTPGRGAKFRVSFPLLHPERRGHRSGRRAPAGHPESR